MLLVSPLVSVWFSNCLTWSHCGNSFRSLSFCFRSHYSKALCSSVARVVIELGSCGTKSGNLCFYVCGVFVFPILSGRFMVCHILTLIIWFQARKGKVDCWNSESVFNTVFISLVNPLFMLAIFIFSFLKIFEFLELADTFTNALQSLYFCIINLNKFSSIYTKSY